MSKVWNKFEGESYGACNEIKSIARSLRGNPSHAESVLWFYLRSRKLLGYKFRRQHPIGVRIADFYCHSLKLVVEIEGSRRDDPLHMAWDMCKAAEFKNLGIEMLRFSNTEVLNSPESVINSLKQKIINLSRR